VRAESLLSLSLPAQQSSCTFPFFLFFPLNTTQRHKPKKKKKMMADFTNGVTRSWSNQIISSPMHAQTNHPSSVERLAVGIGTAAAGSRAPPAPPRFAPVARARDARFF